MSLTIEIAFDGRFSIETTFFPEVVIYCALLQLHAVTVLSTREDRA